MKSFFKNPLTLWFKWYLTSMILKLQNKNLKIGYLSTVQNVKFGNYNTIYNNVKISNTTIGDYVYIQNTTQIQSSTIGNFCSIGANVKVGLGIHPTTYFTTFPSFFSIRKQCQVSFVDKNYFKETGSNYIGNDVWIGDNVTILSNITIGDGAIIAAGAVVTKDVKPYSIVGGVPAKFIKYRFNNTIIKKLLSIKWWEKDIDWIIKNMPEHKIFKSIQKTLKKSTRFQFYLKMFHIIIRCTNNN